MIRYLSVSLGNTLDLVLLLDGESKSKRVLSWGHPWRSPWALMSSSARTSDGPDVDVAERGMAGTNGEEVWLTALSGALTDHGG